MEKGRSTSLRLSSQSNKLIPRDITELGKLPPQAIPLEETVLGALMIEVNAIEQVPYLSKDHFYTDAHREIFFAIKQLADEKVKPDMRAVVARLQKLGKLEIVGGAYVIAQLTANVVSAANIDHHARIIVEMAMKRDMIQIASQIHHDAYEDTVDVFELLEKTRNDLQFLEERETASSGPERIKAAWDKTLILSKPEEQLPLIMLDGCPIATPANHSLLIGKKKSRKSLLVTQLIYLYLKNREHLAEEVAIFDTEQGKKHVWQARDRVYRMTNQWIPVFYLRGMSPQERRDFIMLTVIHWETKFAKPLRIIYIDGIRDLMSNINDPDESTELIVWLEKLTLEHNVHICNILHINKTDNNARGHIGSELLNKAEVTIEVEYDEKTTFSKVKCESSREKPFEPFMFTHGPTGLPEIIGQIIGSDNVAQNEQFNKLELIFEGSALKYTEFKEGIKAHFAVGENKAKQQIAKFVAQGWVMKSGPARSNNTTYKLNARVNGDYVPPIQVHKAQSTIDFISPEHEPPEQQSDLLNF